MKTRLFDKLRREPGFALLMVLILVSISFMVLGATMSRSTSSSKLIDRNNTYQACLTAAEASSEKALAMMLSDYQQGSETRLLANLANYQNAVPGTGENNYWTNFTFTDAQGNNNKNYVARTSTATNPVFMALSEQYAGLSGFSSNYRILSNVKPVNGTYNVTGAVQQDLQVAEIPIFQFAVFYNGLMEYTWCAPFTVTGRVHCNSNIYVGSSSALTFSYLVTAVGIITNIAWDGHTQGSYSGAVTYSGGSDTGYNTLTLPVGTSNTPAAVREIINMPTNGESVTSAIGQERYYNEAGMVILVSDSNIVVNLKTSPSDSGISFTNTFSATNTAAYTNYDMPYFKAMSTTNYGTNLTAAMTNNFVNTTNVFYDDRNNQMMKTTQIDVGKLGYWMTNMLPTNNYIKGKNISGNPLLGIVYVADLRSTNSTTNTAIRLTDGQSLPTNGLTVATLNPLYIWGNYNCPSNAFQGTTNTTVSAPASVACDAVTLLSPGWVDANAGSGAKTTATPTGSKTDTVNCAIIAGIVYSTGSDSNSFSGGVMNLPRLLEDWSSGTLTLNTSIVNLYNSVRATTQFVNPGAYYYAPSSRNFNFDQNYTQSGKLPPGTPRIRRILRATWCNPPPGVTNYVPQTNDYVPY